MASLGRDIAAWPVPLRRAVDSIAVMLMQVYMLARGRAAASASPVVRTLAGQDEETWKLTIRERELALDITYNLTPYTARPLTLPPSRAFTVGWATTTFSFCVAGSFAGDSERFIDQQGGNAETRGLDGLNKRPNRRDDTAPLGPQEDSDGSDHAKPQLLGDPARLLVVEDYLGSRCLERYGDRMRLTVPQLNFQDGHGRRIRGILRLQPGDCDSYFSLNGGGHIHGGEDARKQRQLSDTLQRDQAGAVGYGFGAQSSVSPFNSSAG